MYEEQKREKSSSSSSSSSSQDDEDYYVEFVKLKKKQPTKTTPMKIQNNSPWKKGKSPIRIAPKKQVYNNRQVEKPLPTLFGKVTPDSC